MNPKLWLTLGLIAQTVFSARFIVQWLASERAGRSVVPAAFWWLSLTGSGLLMLYALHLHDPVIILGQGSGLAVYLRNLYLRHRERQALQADGSAREPDAAETTAPAKTAT